MNPGSGGAGLSPGSGGQGSGGQPGGPSGGSSSTGGVPGQGTGSTTGTGGEGPNGTGGEGTDAGSGGDGGGMDPVVPSAGCGKSNPQTGSQNSPLQAGKYYYVKLPTNYDPNEPYRVLFFFNPTGGGNDIGWAERSAGYESLSAKDTAIRVYPHESNDPSAGSPNGWSPDDIDSFSPLYDAIVNNFCVDTARVFAAGESSGGEFAGYVGCVYGDKMRGVAPGAPKQQGGWNFDQRKSTCTGNPTAIVIWSERDSVLQQPAGAAFRDFYRDLNGCQMSDTPVEGFTDNLSNCKMFDGCMAGSDTYYCMHEDPEYSNTYHGWPKMGARMTWGVFEEL